MMNMDPEEKRVIAEQIVRSRRLPYSIEVVEVNNNNYKVINNFGSEITYIKKGDTYYLEEELE